MDPSLDAPGADDDASGVAVSMNAPVAEPHRNGRERAFSRDAPICGDLRRGAGIAWQFKMLEWVKQQGYTVGGMLDNDIVGSDAAASAPHRVRLFSGSGDQDDNDSSSRELARAIEEIDGQQAIHLIFTSTVSAGGDHFVFYKAGLPAVRFTEPLEDYRHQHQTPRTENDVEYGDQVKYLNFTFMGKVAQDNAEALRQLALAPAPPTELKLSGGISPDAKLAWSSMDDAVERF